MSKARVRNGRNLLLKVSFTACALIALAISSAQKAPAAELRPLKQLVEAALRSSEPEARKPAADTQPSKPASQSAATAAIQSNSPEAATQPDALAMTPIANALPGENALRNSGRRSAVHVEIIGKDPMPVVVVSKAKAPVNAAALVAPVSKPVVRVAAKGDESHCLATAIYFEARGESAKGQKAVAEVVLARTRVPGRPKSICGVVYEGSKRRTGCQFSFTCDGASDVARNRVAWARAQKIAASAIGARKKNSVVRGATFYHAAYVSPGWASRMVKVAQIGTHIFYRPKRGRLF